MEHTLVDVAPRDRHEVTINLRRLLAYALLLLAGFAIGIMFGARAMLWAENGYVPFLLSGPEWLYYLGAGLMGLVSWLILRRESR